jgi:calmodulin
MAEAKFDADQLADLKQAFAQVDKDNDGVISNDELGALLRVLGQNVSDSEVTALSPSGTATYAQFLSIMAQNAQTLDSAEDIIRAFKVFDKGNKGFITNSEFRKAMTAYGGKFGSLRAR